MLATRHPLPALWNTFLHRVSRWSWPVTLLIALAYTLCFANFIRFHTDLPTYDGAAYVSKTYTIAAAAEHKAFLQHFHPSLYLAAYPAERPPLLLGIAALTLGPDAHPQSIALVWVLLRVGAILLGLFILARTFRSARFVPAAACIIFASPMTTNFFRLFMMDEPFAAFGLLAFALILADDRRQSVLSATGAGLGILLLFLVKPVAPAFLFPLLALRAARAFLPTLFHWWSTRRKPRTRPLDSAPTLTTKLIPLFFWSLPYLATYAIMLWLLTRTAYGPAIRAQYHLGKTGFWHHDLVFRDILTLLSYLVPPWLVLAFLLLLPFARRWQKQPALLYTVVAGGWWILFSFFLTYTVEDRLLAQAMPLLVAGLLVFLCQRPTPAFLLTCFAAFFFTFCLLTVGGRINPDRTNPAVATIRFLSPDPGYMQPLGEVGLFPFTRRLLTEIPAPQSAHIVGLFADSELEPAAAELALRLGSPHALGRISVQFPPIEPHAFDILDILNHRWFITKLLRPSQGFTNTGLFTSFYTINELLTAPDSPLRPYLHEVFSFPVHQPWFEDTLIVWNIPAPLPRDAQIAILRWLPAKLTPTDPRQKILARQLQQLLAEK